MISLCLDVFLGIMAKRMKYISMLYFFSVLARFGLRHGRGGKAGFTWYNMNT